MDQDLDRSEPKRLGGPVADERDRPGGEPAPARGRRDPVADLAVAIAAGELHQAEGAGEATVAVLGLQRQDLAGSHLRLAPGQPRLGVLAPVRGGNAPQRWIAASWQAAVTASASARRG